MVTPPRTGGVGGQGGPAAASPHAYFEALENALSAIEAAGDALASAPRSAFDLRPAARALERGAAGLLDAYDARREVGSALEEATAACDEAERAIEEASKVDEGLRPAVGWVKKASAWLRSALDSAARAPARSVVARDVLASRDTPAHHAILRATLVPIYAVAPPLPPVAAPEPAPDPSLPLRERMTLLRERAEGRRTAATERRAVAEEKRAQARLAAKVALDPPLPGFVPGSYRPSTPEAVVAARARECFEEIAALGMMRIPLLGDLWRTSAVFDTRMLTSIDAVAAMGPQATSALERFVVDAPAKDPSRGFAISMIGGCFEGRDALALVERCLRFLGLEDRETLRQAAEALALVPHPDLANLLRRWLQSSEPGLRALAIDVLARRGEATAYELARALGDADPSVIEKALVPSALAKIPELAARAEELVLHTHEGMAGPLAWAFVLADVPFAMTRLADWLGTAREDAALLPYVIAGDRDEVARIVDLSEKRPKRPRLAALGWSGTPKSFRVLLRVLREAKDDELKLSAAFALDRITGARIYEDALVPPELLDVPEPDEPEDPGGAPPVALARRVGDPRDLPAEGSPDRAQFPTTDAARWEAWLASRPDAFAEDKRYRRGRAYTPAISLEELDREPLVSYERRVLYRELVIKTGHAHPFDPHAFVSTQEAQLAAWVEAANRGSSQPGSWGRARRR